MASTVNGFVLLRLALLYYFIAFVSSKEQQRYSLIGVSGTLQDGFPLRDRLDYHNGSDPITRVPAILIGRALVRGYKAYLDVKDAGWREYVAAGGNPCVPNAVVIPTSCREHANIFWIYAVDDRQVLEILSGEPRFLSITPDTGLVELNAVETDQAVRTLARREIERQGLTDTEKVAIPLVTGVWFHPTYIESPPVLIKEDGTQVTSYEGSLALWAGVSPKDLIGDPREGASCQVIEEGDCVTAWERVYQVVRKAEEAPPSTAHPATIACRERVRFGVGASQARLNYPMTASYLLSILEEPDKEAE